MTTSPVFREAVDTWRTIRDAYGDLLEQQFLDAEAATRGNLLNATGKTKRINPRDLFMGPEVRARAYASEELITWWQTHPRVTFEQFERGATRAASTHECPACGHVA